MSRIPTRSQINVYCSLDEQTAVENFLGKDLQQAEAMFRDNFMCYQEDLSWMGPEAFCFYVPAAISYLHSPDATGDSDAVNCFCGTLEFQLDSHGSQIEPARRTLLAAVEQIIADFSRFDCDPSLYGDLKGRYLKLRERLLNAPATHC